MSNIILRNVKFLILWGIIMALLASIISLFLPKYYSGQSDVLITAYNRNGVDQYTQAKSAERVGEDLSQVVGTTDFYKKVMDVENATFDKNSWLSLSERKQRKLWQKNVSAGMNYGSSMLHLTVYAKTKAETVGFSQAIVATLVNHGWEYVGTDVTIKPVNDALVSTLPARPNFAINAFAGFVLGFLLSAWWVIKNR